jgi:hypothetical protein
VPTAKVIHYRTVPHNAAAWPPTPAAKWTGWRHPAAPEFWELPAWAAGVDLLFADVPRRRCASRR